MNSNALDYPFGQPTFDGSQNSGKGSPVFTSEVLAMKAAAVDSITLSTESLTYLSHKQSCWQCGSNRELCSTGYRLLAVAVAREDFKEVA